jgi:hypothetical protein
MKLNNGKISFWSFLPIFAPVDNSNGGTGGGSDDNNQNGNQQQQPGNQGGKPGEIDLESENLVDDLLGNDEDDDDGELDFGNDDDSDDDDPDEAARIQNSTKTLGELLNSKINGIGLKPEDIPADFDASDSAQVAKLLTTTNQNLAKEVISVIPEVLKHALGIIVPKLEKKIQTASVSTNKKAELNKSFNSLGLKGADKALGLQVYKSALGKGMTPEKAAKATGKALAQLRGGSNQSFNSNGNNRSGGDNKSGMKTGANALDAMFGKS